MEINPYNSGGAKLEVLSTQTSIACGIVPAQTVANIRVNVAFRSISDASNCERITKTSPTQDGNNCCTTTTTVGSWQTYDDINTAINFAETNIPTYGSGTVIDPFIIAA
jgi:hypothetical protein